MTKPWFVLLVAVLAPTVMAQGDGSQRQVPAYHATPPHQGENLPPLLPKEQLLGPSFQQAFQVHAYELAAGIPRLIYQMPCYCYCDRSIGHSSLHSCYQSTHAANCGVCMKELYYSYGMHKQKRTAAQIRRGIIQGDWQQVDLVSAADMK